MTHIQLMWPTKWGLEWGPIWTVQMIIIRDTFEGLLLSMFEVNKSPRSSVSGLSGGPPPALKLRATAFVFFKFIFMFFHRILERLKNYNNNTVAYLKLLKCPVAYFFIRVKFIANWSPSILFLVFCCWIMLFVLNNWVVWHNLLQKGPFKVTEILWMLSFTFVHCLVGWFTPVPHNVNVS